MAYDFSSLKDQTQKIIEWLQKEIAGFRTGRATPALVENLAVDYHGTKTPLKQIASISVQDARTLLIQPWDKTAILQIEEAIRRELSGLQPMADKEILRLILPELTTERRKELLKTTNKKLEEAKITLRQERDKIWKDIQDKERGGELTEDEKFKEKEEMQKIVDEAGKELEEVAEKKKKEIES